MNSSLNLPPQAVYDQARVLPDAPSQQSAGNPMVEWQMFLKMVEAVCHVYGFELECNPDNFAFIVAGPTRVCNPANAWQLALIVDESSEQSRYSPYFPAAPGGAERRIQ